MGELKSLAKPLVFGLTCIPMGLLVYDGFMDGLGANPVEEITRRTGGWALKLLLVTLAVTPIRILTGWNAVMRIRRMLGLFAFFYLCLHFLTYAWLDAYFDVGYILEDILERPYITVGFTSFCLLVPLAVTSTDRMIRRLGGRRWRLLHRLAYGAGAGGVLHFLWLVKADLIEPLAYVSVLGLLFLIRTPAVTRIAGRLRASRRARTEASPRLAV